MKSNFRLAIQWLRSLGRHAEASRAKRRRCGPCTLCCQVRGVMDVAGQVKPPGTRCRFQGHGCSIHPTRPQECRAYFCAWRLGLLRESDRPDQTRVVPDFQVLTGEGSFAWTVRPFGTATAETTADVLERLVTAWPARFALVPFGLPGKAPIVFHPPTSSEVRKVVDSVLSGAFRLVSDASGPGAMSTHDLHGSAVRERPC